MTAAGLRNYFANMLVMGRTAATSITWCDWQVEWGFFPRRGCHLLLSFLDSFSHSAFHSVIHSFNHVFIQKIANARRHTMRDEAVYLQRFCVTGCNTKFVKRDTNSYFLPASSNLHTEQEQELHPRRSQTVFPYPLQRLRACLWLYWLLMLAIFNLSQANTEKPTRNVFSCHCYLGSMLL